MGKVIYLTTHPLGAFDTLLEGEQQLSRKVRYWFRKS